MVSPSGLSLKSYLGDVAPGSVTKFSVRTGAYLSKETYRGVFEILQTQRSTRGHLQTRDNDLRAVVEAGGIGEGPVTCRAMEEAGLSLVHDSPP